MDYRTLGHSGCAVSSLCLGTMTFGIESRETSPIDQLDRFVEAGGTMVDTADTYSPRRSEEIIGRWFAAGRGHRAGRARDQGPLSGRRGDLSRTGRAGRAHLTRALDAALRRLGRDAVDLYQVHA